MTERIAIIGLACRFPGARNPAEFWHNLSAGRESIRFFTAEELLAAGVDPALIADPRYVRAQATLDGIEDFDATFFGMSPREAEATDPQHRLFLEVAWEALEDAAYDPERYAGPIGVYAGAGLSTYLLNNLLPNYAKVQALGHMQLLMGNNKDYVPTRASYKFNLTGPSFNVNTACSTSLVAVHLACQALLDFQADMALAGGVGIQVPQTAGYIYEDGNVTSPDGHCRAFDVNAQGTVSGNGAGVVVLKRLSEAQADGDHIYAVIRGSAINNDGARKIGFTAPSVEGQARVIAEAHAFAEIHPEDLSYIEAHGTGTPLGDPIEVRALTQVFRAKTAKVGYCALGTVKSNFGHLDEAAGVAGLIKTVLALQNKALPASLHFTTPNPQLQLESSPFFVNTTLRAWDTNGAPRCAGVSSFGLGGTNAHLIVEEFLSNQQSAIPNQQALLLPLSARTPTALAAAAENLAAYLEQHPTVNVRDVAYTLALGRKAFAHRRAIVAATVAEAIRALRLTATSAPALESPQVVFLFPGQGMQSLYMARDLYEYESVFRAAFDECAAAARPHLDRPLPEILFPSHATPEVEAALHTMTYAQPTLFAVQYALAQLWRSWGIMPHALLGHSLGEYTAACVAGVFTVAEAMLLVCARGRLMQASPPSGMLAVALSEAELQPYLNNALSLAVINAPDQCVIGGAEDALAVLEQTLTAHGVQCQRLRITRASHSHTLESALGEFAALTRQVTLRPPHIPYFSNVSGAWITPVEAIDPEYWVRHLRQTVRFAEAVQTLTANPRAVFIELGPGRVLGSLVRAQAPEARVIQALRHPKETHADHFFARYALGQAWSAGVAFDWNTLFSNEKPRRVSLPTYPFERQRYWIDAPRMTDRALPTALPARHTDLADWFYTPSWHRLPPHQSTWSGEKTCLLIGQATTLAASLREQGWQVWLMASNTSYAELAATLPALPALILHAPAERGFESLVALTQALTRRFPDAPTRLCHITRGAHQVLGAETVVPEHVLALGALKVIAQEYPHWRCHALDQDTASTWAHAWLSALHPALEPVCAFRGGHLWAQNYVPMPLTAPSTSRLRPGGVYLITGGLGEVGLIVAAYLARAYQAQLALLSRAPEQADARQLAWVNDLRASGAKVLLLAADVADEVALSQAIAQTERELGPLHGVIHAAGDTRPEVIFRSLDELTSAITDAIFQARVRGTQNLAACLGDKTLDFVLLISSNAATLGGLGFGAYAAATAFMDAFAQAQGTPWVSANWDGWPNAAWPNAAWPNAEVQSAAQIQTSLDRYAFSRAEAEAALERVLTAPAPQVVVSAGDFGARWQYWSRPTLKISTTPSDSADRPDALSSEAPARHNRPSLSVPYTAPRDDTEQAVARAWEDLLGIQPIGVQDSFFDLRGDSLLAAQMMARLHKTLLVKLPLSALFDDPTVAGLSARIRQMSAAPIALPPVAPLAADEEEGEI